MADEKFMVVIDIEGDSNGGLVNAGGDKKPGLEQQVAEADAKARNKRAEELGIQTRYQVVPLS